MAFMYNTFIHFAAAVAVAGIIFYTVPSTQQNMEIRLPWD